MMGSRGVPDSFNDLMSLIGILSNTESFNKRLAELRDAKKIADDAAAKARQEAKEHKTALDAVTVELDKRKAELDKQAADFDRRSRAFNENTATITASLEQRETSLREKATLLDNSASFCTSEEVRLSQWDTTLKSRQAKLDRDIADLERQQKIASENSEKAAAALTRAEKVLVDAQEEAKKVEYDMEHRMEEVRRIFG